MLPNFEKNNFNLSGQVYKDRFPTKMSFFLMLASSRMSSCGFSIVPDILFHRKTKFYCSCVNKWSGRRVRRHHCDELLRGSSLAGINSRDCNTASCEFEWIATEWEHCTHSCGAYGSRYTFYQTFPFSSKKYCL